LIEANNNGNIKLFEKEKETLSAAVTELKVN
jgi:hypothetical protein